MADHEHHWVTFERNGHIYARCTVCGEIREL